MKVLFADDNAYALEYFKSMMPEEGSGFTLAGTALDGEQAWEIFQEQDPEIVITDIQMPVIDGIELARRILRARPSTVVYFLSSYEEFSYAKSALSIGVSDYLLKHEVTKERLLEKLIQAREQILKSSDQQHYIDEGNFRELLFCHSRETDSRAQKIMHQMHGRFSVCLLIQDEVYPVFRPLVHTPVPLIESEELRRFLYSQDPALSAFVELSASRSALLFTETDPLRDHLFRLCSAVAQACGRTISFVVVSENVPIRSGFSEYAATTSCLERKYFFPPSSILERTRLTRQSPRVSLPDLAQKDLSSPESMELVAKMYSSLILTGDAEEFRSLTQTVLDYLAGAAGNIFNPVTGEVFRLSGMESGASFYDADSIAAWAGSQLRSLAAFQEAGKDDPSSPSAGRLMAILLNRYADSSLSVEEIAGQMRLSVNQLNHIAKTEYGMTVNKMITRVRMEKAARLLAGPAPVSEVAQRTGYNSVSYFSNAFRKYYGISPQEYRKQQ